MRSWALWFCLIGCGGAPAPAPTPPRPPVVIPPPPANPAAKAPTGTLAVGESARWPADMPVQLDAS